jgi:outer membrane protein OmpA-like peptidoglycan-associated protein
MTISKFAKNGLLLAGLLSTPLCVASEPLYDSVSLPPNIADDDKDGVINVRDFCPDTALGSKVDNDGCPTQSTHLQSINLEVLFDTGKFDVKPMYYPEIQKLADFMNANPNTTVIIEGHTDSVGDDKDNIQLSRNRANAIALVVIRQFGINRERIRGVGYGESRPISTNETAQGREKNRRVVAEIYSEQTSQTKRWNIYSVDNMATTPSMPTPPALQFDTSSNGMPQTDLQFDTSGEATGW